MSWKTFLARLRQFFLFDRVRTRRRSIKPLPNRRKRVFDFEPFEDRSHMEPPITSLAATAVGVGVGVYAVNLAVANALARAEAAAPATPVVPESAAETGPMPEFLPIQSMAAAWVPHEYAGAAEAAPEAGLSRFEIDGTL